MADDLAEKWRKDQADDWWIGNRCQPGNKHRQKENKSRQVHDLLK